MLKALSSTLKLLLSTTSPRCQRVQESGPTLRAPCSDTNHWTERGTVALNHWNLGVSDAEPRVLWLNVTSSAQVHCVKIWSIHLRVVFKIKIVKMSSLFALNGILCSWWPPAPFFISQPLPVHPNTDTGLSYFVPASCINRFTLIHLIRKILSSYSNCSSPLLCRGEHDVLYG